MNGILPDCFSLEGEVVIRKDDPGTWDLSLAEIAGEPQELWPLSVQCLTLFANNSECYDWKVP